MIVDWRRVYADFLKPNNAKKGVFDSIWAKAKQNKKIREARGVQMRSSVERSHWSRWRSSAGMFLVAPAWRWWLFVVFEFAVARADARAAVAAASDD